MLAVILVECYDTVLGIADQIVYQDVFEHELIRRVSIAKGDRGVD
jgi:hypothetical protein